MSLSTIYCALLGILIAYAINAAHADVHEIYGNYAEPTNSKAFSTETLLKKMFPKEIISIKKHFNNNAHLLNHPRAKAIVGTVEKENKYTNYAYIVANLSIGTPEQYQLAYVDFWETSSLYVKDVNNLSRYDAYIKAISYNSTISSTYESDGKNSTFWGYPISYARDVFRFNNSVFNNVTLKLASSRLLWSLLPSYKLSMSVGLLPSPIYYEDEPVFVKEIASELDEAVVTLSINKTSSYTRQTKISLGNRDPANCNSDWVFAPAQWGNPFKLFNASVVTSVFSNNSIAATTKNVSLYVPSYGCATVVTKSIREILVNITNAKYDEIDQSYKVNCSLQSENNTLTLNLGGEDETDKTLSIPISDLISNTLNYCYLEIYELNAKGYGEFIITNSRFLDNHCLAHDINSDNVGIATAKNI